VNTILVQGMAVAVPIILVAAATGALVRHRWPRSDAPAPPLTRRGFTATVAAIVLLAVIIAVLTWGILPDFHTTWLEPTFG
jgi:multisubunit Na+/H+ antiporter MnhB subunit